VELGAQLGKTGGAARLLLLWNARRFAKLDAGELTAVAQGATAPLWVQLRDLASEQVFLVMVNHLHPAAEQRHLQAQMLNAWAGSQSLPIVALGDYNFAWPLPSGAYDRGFDDLTVGGNWQWVRPATLVATSCQGSPCATGVIDDFVFVAGPARDWPAVAEVMTDGSESGAGMHRPVRAVLAGGRAVETPVAAAASASAAATPDPATCPRPNRNSNVRQGPGMNYAVLETLRTGTCVSVDGRTERGEWLHLAGRGWVAAYLLSGAPPLDTLPVLPAP
jgi:hypothetical protein